MPTPTHSARSRAPDEKITINLGVIDLGRIDLLVQEGFYASRSELIRGAVRAELARHAGEVESLVARRMLILGIHRFTAARLRAARDDGEPLAIRVLGLAVFDDDIDPSLAEAAIASITVLGAVQATPALRAALRALPDTPAHSA